MTIEMHRGTNPTISVAMEAGITLVPTKDVVVNSESVTRKSCVTIRRSMDKIDAITADDELQIEIEKTDVEEGVGTHSDSNGNVFTVQPDRASLYLSQEFTKMLTEPVYFLQFNLIKENGDMFVVEPMPIMIHVLANIAYIQ